MREYLRQFIGALASAFVISTLISVLPPSVQTAQAADGYGRCTQNPTGPSTCTYPPFTPCTLARGQPNNPGVPVFVDQGQSACNYIQGKSWVSVDFGMLAPEDFCIVDSRGNYTNIPCAALNYLPGQQFGGVVVLQPPSAAAAQYAGDVNKACTMRARVNRWHAITCYFDITQGPLFDIDLEAFVDVIAVGGGSYYGNWKISVTLPLIPVAVVNYTNDKNVFHFDGTASFAQQPQAEVISWFWSIDGGLPVSNMSAFSFTFAVPGAHTVTLIVSDSTGSHSLPVTITVSGPSPPGIVVNSTGDAVAEKPANGCYTGNMIANGDAECTLRAAIQAVNAGFAKEIDFNIPGASTTMTPGSDLPNIAAANSTIDATTQPTGKVVLDGRGLYAKNASGVTIKGLTIVNGPGYAVLFDTSPNGKLVGSAIGMKPDGSAAQPAGGVAVAGSPGTQIGGPGAADANVISAPTAVFVSPGNSSGQNVQILGNYICVDKNGKAVGSCDFGVLAAASGLQAKGLTIDKNTIAGAKFNVVVAGEGMDGLKITNNHVGTNPGGDTAIGTPIYNIRVDGVPNAIVSGNTVSGAPNDILVAGSIELTITPGPNGTDNIHLNPPDFTSLGNPISGVNNTISGNNVGLVVSPSASSQYGIRVWGAGDSTTIAGNTTDGHATREISIKGGKSHSITNNIVGVNFNAANTGAGIVVEATDKSSIDSNVVGARGNAYRVISSTMITLSNNTSGLAKDGSTKAAVGTGVNLSTDSSNLTVGPNNTLANATNAGLFVGGQKVSVFGNKIGVPAFGSGLAGNDVGIVLSPSAGNVTIGTKAAPNILAGNRVGLQINGKSVTVESNKFGLVTSGALGNGTAIEANADSTIHANTIANSTTIGVKVAAGANVTLRANPIYATGTVTNGIVGAPAAPTLAAAAQVQTGTSVRTWLVVSGLPTSGDGLIEVFGNPSCADPEGKVPLFTKLPWNGKSTRVINLSGRVDLKGITVTYTTAAGATSVFSNCLAPTTMPDTDGDGIPDVVEANAPVPTADDARVVSFLADSDQWISLLAPEGATFSNVALLDDPDPLGHPGKSFPYGLLSFTVSGVPKGSIAAIGVVLPNPAGVNTWVKYGPISLGATPTFWGFGYDAQTQTGANFATANVPGYGQSTILSLLIQDGGRGDENFVADGIIKDPGGPAFDASIVQQVTTTDIASTNSTTAVGQPVTFTATVTGNSPTGTVQFMDGAAALGAAVALTGGTAMLTTSALAQGTHAITAVYSGDSNNLGSTSSIVMESVTTASGGGGQLATPIPTLADWALILLSLILAAIAMSSLRRRKVS